MKLIINTVNLKVGGAFQRAISFLKELKEIGKDEFHVFYNKDIGEQVEVNSYPSNFKFYFFEHSPASLKYRKKIVKKFNRLEKEINPDVVFSFVGPSYWKPKSLHLVGFGVPHIVYNDYKYVKKYSLKTKLEMVYKKYWTKKEADYFVVQTEDVKKRLAKRININESKIKVVTNGFGKQYKGIDAVKRNENNIKKLLMISTYRPSKNFEIIKDIIPYLKKDIYTYEFHITINKDDYRNTFKGYEKSVINHGHIRTDKCPELYNECDAMFLPSHLECFSASYPEAMKMEKPILTSDLSFAHTVCGDAAIYFNNLAPKEISERIKQLFHDKVLYEDLIKKGKERLNVFDTSRKQAEKYIDFCKEIIHK